MLSNAPDFRHRARLIEKMDQPCSRDDLRACLRDIARLNRWIRADRSLFNWLGSLNLSSVAQRLRILDVGCGNGDGLRRIERWAHDRNLAVDLIGLDISPDVVAIAAELTPPTSSIQWIAADVFSYVPPRPIHIVVSSLLTHHLADIQLVRFLQWMERHAALGWFINDLSRAAVPYHFIRIFARLARLHPFVQYDAPVSIARAFVPADWQTLCAAANLTEREVSIQRFRPARLCVARRKPQ
ncbi:MAG TPA: methyltransferase domain-containing protein [Terracidiphilus sp.]|nr:methyltransferase domain-containing protein [Terracidiphilus sp.]